MPVISVAGLLERYPVTLPYPVLSFATARDYSDSYDHLRPLATAMSDLKDYQRPWVLKAILGHVPPGSSVLEIGAGEPVVGEILSELGYRVTIVDPYEGYANGPVSYDQFRTSLPKIRFVRDLFRDGLFPDSEKFDCICSISVMEHIPLAQLPGVVAGIRRHLRPGGWSIHAVDWVIRGQLDEFHQLVGRILAEEMGLDPESVDRLRDEALVSTETCLLSAHAHALWRGRQSYDMFPFRTTASLQLVVPSVNVLQHNSRSNS